MINMSLMKLAGEVSTIAKRTDLSYRIARSTGDGTEPAHVTMTPDLHLALELMLQAVRELREPGTIALIVDKR